MAQRRVLRLALVQPRLGGTVTRAERAYRAFLAYVESKPALALLRDAYQHAVVGETVEPYCLFREAVRADPEAARLYAAWTDRGKGKGLAKARAVRKARAA